MASVAHASPSIVVSTPATGRAVFDLDRTLIRGSSLARLARALNEARLVRRKDLTGHLVREAVFAVRGFGPSTIDRLRTSLLQAAAGVEQAPLLEVTERVGPLIAADIYPAARWLVDSHLSAGHDVVLLSSSPQELVDAVARAVDPSITAVGTLAEVVDGCYTGALAAPFCHGAGKIVRLQQVLGWRELEHTTAYADSESDLPVLRAASTAVAVNPDRALRAVATNEGWPILDLS